MYAILITLDRMTVEYLNWIAIHYWISSSWEVLADIAGGKDDLPDSINAAALSC